MQQLLGLGRESYYADSNTLERITSWRPSFAQTTTIQTDDIGSQNSVPNCVIPTRCWKEMGKLPTSCNC